MSNFQHAIREKLPCLYYSYYIHTVQEYSRLLRIHDVDEYIRYGGTFKVGETDFGNFGLQNNGSSFRDDESTRKYIDTAIARNIQHSLEYYRFGGHFRHLIDLYDKGELTSAINRIIEDMNHRFVLEVLTKDFVSHDFGSAKTHVIEIKQYLENLDLIVNIPSHTIETYDKQERFVFTQPGMRYCQVQALVYALMEDKGLMQYTPDERKEISDLILDDVKGRMLEDIVILETQKSLPRWKKVFKLEFEYGEFDMVIYNEKELTCKIFEIKHSSEIVDDQFKHLVDEEKCRRIELKYGRIISKIVLYRGKDTVYKGIEYRNIAEYLEGLSEGGQG